MNRAAAARVPTGMPRSLAALATTIALPLLASCARGEAAGMHPLATGGKASRPQLVELFTSQGCSSCPPADHLLARLAAQPAGGRTVIPLAFHVDYWNYIGWKDPFSSAEWSRRQERYGATFGGNGIYTPELVVAGRGGCVGTDAASLRRLVTAAVAEPDVASVTVERGNASSTALPVTVHAERRREASAGPAEVLVALYENGLETPVRGGENASLTLHDERVVRRLERVTLLPAGGGGATATLELRLEPQWRRQALGVVAFVQEPGTLRVLAAAEAP